MVLIQLKTEADVAKLIDLIRKNPKQAGQALYDASARWEQMYFGEDAEPPAVKVFDPLPIGKVETIYRVKEARK